MIGRRKPVYCGHSVTVHPEHGRCRGWRKDSWQVGPIIILRRCRCREEHCWRHEPEVAHPGGRP